MKIYDPHITGSLSVSSSAEIQGDLVVSGTIYGTAQIEGQVQDAVSASHAASYLLTSSFEIYTASAATTGSNTFIGDQTFSGSLLPQGTTTHDLGSDTLRWNDIYLAGSTVDIGGTKISKDGSGDVEIKDSNGNLKRVIASELEIGTGNNKIKIKRGNNGRINILDTSDNTELAELSGSFTGSFRGDGSFLTNVPADSVTGLNLARISNTTATASISTAGLISNVSIIPDTTDTIDLGSPTKQWRDLYLSSGSLYINGQQVLSTTGTELRVTTDSGESIKILEEGSDTITLQSENGDITLTSSGTGNIELDAPIQITAGNKVLSSDGNSIVFGNGLIITGSITLTGNVDGVDVGTFKSTFDTTTGSFDGRLDSLETNSGSQATSIIDLETFQTSVETGLQFTGSNVTIKGDLLVKGTETRVNSTTVDIDDNIISLNGTGATDAGIEVRDTESPGTLSGSLIYDTGDNVWKAGIKGSEENIILQSDYNTLSGRLGSLETTSGSNKERLNEIEFTTGSHSGRLDSLETKSGSHSGRLDSIETFTSSIDNTYATDTDVTNLRSTLNTYTSSNDSTNTSQNSRLGSLETISGSNIGRLDSIESFTGSIDNTYATDTDVTNLRSTLNTYTSSNDSTNTSQNNRLGSLETKTGSLETTNTTQNNRLSSLETKTGSLDTDITNLDGRLDSIETFTGSIDDTYASDEDVESLRGDLNSYTSSNDSVINTQNTRLGSLESVSSSHDGRIDSIETKTGSLETTNTSQNNRLSSLETKTGSLDSTNTTQNTRLSSIETKTGSLDSTNTTQNSRLFSLETKTGSLDSDISTLDGRVDSLESKSGSHGGRLDSIETFTSSIDNTYATDTDVTNLRSTLNTYTSSNDTTNTTQNSRLTSLENTSGSHDGRLDSLETNSGSQATQISNLQTHQSTVETGLQFTGSNVTIKGDLLVKGTETRVNSTTVDLSDNIISLNGSGAVNAGLEVRDTEAPGNLSGSLIYDTGDNEWKAGIKGSEERILIQSDLTTLNTKLDGIDTTTGSHNDRINSLETTSGSHNGRLSSLETKTGSLDSDISTLDGRLDSLETKTGSLDTTNTTQNSRLSSIETFTSSIDNTYATDTDVTNLRSDLNSYTSSNNTTNTNQDNRLSSLETKTGSLDTNITNLDGRIDSLETESGSVRSDFNSYTSSNDSTNTSQNNRLGSLETKTGSLNTSISNIENRLGSLETDSGSQDGRLDSLESKSGSHNDRLTSLETFTGSIDDEYATDGDVTDLRNTLNTYTSSNNGTNTSQNNRLGSLETKTGSLDSTNTTQNSRLSSLENTSGSHISRLDSIETFTGSIDNTFATDTDVTNLRGDLNTYTSSNNTTNTNQNSRLGSLETTSGSHNDRLGSLETKTGSLDSTNTTQNSRLSSLETKTGSLDSDISTLDGRVDSLETKTGSLDSTNTTQNSRLSSLETNSGSQATQISNLETHQSTVETGLQFTGSNVTVKGNLLVKGTETRVNSTTVDIDDNIISLNGSGAASAGIEVRDTTSPGTLSGSLIWDGSNNHWKGGTKTNEQRLLTDSDLSTLNDRLNFIETESGSIRSDFNTYTSSNDSTNTSQNSRLSSLETKTGSLDSTNTTQNNRISSLETKTGSLEGSVDSIETFTSSINTTIKNKLNTETVISGSEQVDHDATINFEANEHIDHSTVTIGSGKGLSGGGTITTSRSLTLDTGSNHFLGGVKEKLNSETVVSGSEQIDITATTNYNLVGGRLDSIETKTGSLDSTNTSQNSRLSSLETFTGSIDNTYATDTDVTNLRNTLNTYTSSNDTTNTNQNNRLGSLETKTGSLDSSVNTLDGRVDSLETKTGSLDSTNTSQNNRLNSIETKTGSLDSTNTSQNNRLDSIETKTGSLDSSVNTLDGRVDSLETTSGSHKSRLDSIESVTGSYLTSHPSISAASSSDNSGRTYIQDITLDSNGHVTGLSTATETVVNTDEFVTGATWNNSNAVLTFTRNDGDTFNVTLLDTLSDVTVTGGTYNSGTQTLTLTKNDGNTVSVSGFAIDTDVNYYLTGATFNTSNGVLTLNVKDSSSVTVDLDGRFLTEHPSISAATSSNNGGRTYIQDILLDGNGHVTGVTTATETVTNTDTNFYTTGATFNTGNGIITFTNNQGDTYTVDIDGKFLNVTGDQTMDGSLTLTERFFAVQTASNTTPGYSFSGDSDTGLSRIGTDAVGLIAGGSRKFYVNSTTAYFQNLTGGVEIATGGLAVANDVAAASFTKTGGSSSEFLKADGSVDSNTYLTSHPNISAASSSNNSGRTYIQDVLLDSNGHVTGLTTATESVTNTDEYTTGATFNSGNGVITFTRNDGDTYTVDIDGRFLRTQADVHSELYNTSGDADDYTAFGIYRNYGSNGPISGHNTILNVMQSDGNYGFQIGSNTSASSDGLYFRNKAGANSLTGTTWYQVATRTWVGNQNYLTSHPSISAASSSNNSGRTYIQDILLDSNGHVTGITTATESVTNTDEYTTGATFNTGNGIITFTRNDGDTFSVDIDGRFLTSFTETDPIFVASAAYGITSTNISNWNTAYGWGDHSTAGYLTSYTESDTLATVTARGAATSESITIQNTLTLAQSNTSAVFSGNSSGNFTIDNNTGSIAFQANGSTVNSLTITSSLITLNENVQANGYIDMGTNSITDTKVGQWDTAYGWGDHSTAGYVSNDEYTTGATWNSGTGVLTFTRNDGDTFNVTLLETLSDVTVTGGTYNSSNQTLTLTKSDGNTVSVNGFAVDTDVNWYTTGATFNTGTGVITGTHHGGTWTVDIDGRYLQLSGGNMTGNIVFNDDGEGIEFYSANSLKKIAGTGMVLEVDSSRTDNLVLQIKRGSTYDYMWHTGHFTSTNVSNWNTAYGWGDHSTAGYLTTYNNEYTTGATFNTGNGIITFTRNDGDTYTVDLDGRYLPLGGGSLTGDVTSNSVITADTLRLTSDATDTNRHRISVYDEGATSYGMMLWNTNGTSGEWATMIYGPNQASRRISFGKANANWGNHAGVDELAWLDLDNGNYFTDGVIYPSNQTSHYVSSGRIQNWQTAYGWGDHGVQGYLTSYNDEYTTGATFSTSNGIITFTRNDGDTFTVDIDGRFMTQGLTYTTSPNTINNGGNRYDPSTDSPTNEHYAIITYGNGGNVTGQLATHFQTGKLYSRGHNNSWSGWRSYWSDSDFTSTNVSNWNTAYGWGDHSTAGYVSNDEYTTGATFNTSNGVITFTRNDGDTYSVDLDNRYAYLSHDHARILENSTIQYGTGQLQWTDVSGTGGTGLAGAAPGNPFSDWFHHLIMSHANSSGYYVDIAACFHSDDIYFRRNVGGSLSTWRELWHTGHFTSTNVSNWDTAYGWGNHSGLYLPIGGGTLTGDLTIGGGDLTINKDGNYSTISFPAQTNDPGFIRHYESNNTATMQFSVSDDSGTTDRFEFGYSGQQDRFIIYSNGSFHARGNGSIEGHFTPGVNNTYDLGSSSSVWRNIYTGDLHMSNMGQAKGNDVDGTKGNWTIQEGAENLYIINNNNGKKFRVKLEEV
jgi:chromosome segregation ATPase